MIIFLFGQDTYRSAERLNILRSAFCDKFDKSGVNVDVMYGDSLKIEDLRKAILSQGLLSKKRFVIIKNLISEKKSAQFYEDIANEIKPKSISEDVIVVFWEGSNLEGKKKGNKLYSALKKADKVEVFNELSDIQLRKWIVTAVTKEKGKISNDAVSYLGANIGSNLWLQKTEIDKLLSYKKGELIQRTDVEEFVTLALNDNIFHFTDALANKNTKQAVKLFDDQLNSGANEFYLLTMLVRQFKILLQMKQGLERGQTSVQLQSELKLHPFVIKKSLSQARKFELSELKNIYKLLLNIDTKLKTTGIDPKALFDLFIVEVCQASSN